MIHEKKTVLVTVKAYPNPSSKYTETVCVAGIDLDKSQWIRLYPIPFRDLDDEKKFKKYSIIKVNTTKSSDTRPESYKADADSIEVDKLIDTKDKWEKRKAIVLPTQSKSFCEILKNQTEKDKSLGVFKPTNIDFYWTKRKKERDENKVENIYAQLSFFNKSKNAIEQIPYDFRYTFTCANETSCTGHDLMIVDWELGQAYRSWRWKYKDEDVLLQKIKQRWLTNMCAPHNDVYFFVGNTNRFRDTFLVLGTFYPPKL